MTATMAEPLRQRVTEAALYRLDTPELAQALTQARRSDAEQDQLHAQVVEAEAGWSNCRRLRRPADFALLRQCV